jgi:hypothetical protein
METNHYGKWVDSEVPVCGIVGNNSVEFLNDEIFSHDSVDLTYEQFLLDNPEFDPEEDFYESDDSEYLIGDWLQDEQGLYYPDPNGEYSAKVMEVTTRVYLSKTLKRCALCSPCYPGQADLDSEGTFLAYALPDDLMGGSDEQI